MRTSEAGLLNDFGGGVDAGESYQQAAMREFVEETETLYFEDDVSKAIASPQRVAAQLELMRQRFDDTLKSHPNWWCQRDPGTGQPPKDWRTFFIEVEYRDIRPMNLEWLIDSTQPEGIRRFSKRRELRWIPAHELLRIYREEPQRLWKRVRQLQGAEQVIKAILRHKS